MDRDQLVDYLVNRGYGVVSARGISVLADDSATGVDLGTDGVVCKSSQPGRYLVVGPYDLDGDAERIEHAAKCAS
jgi:hypothetical protein